MSGRLKKEHGSENVFSDLGFPKAEAENLLLRSQLMSEIRDVAEGLTQTQAAKRLGVTQSRLSDLLRGKIDKFSLNTLVIVMNKAGMHIEMKV